MNTLGRAKGKNIIIKVFDTGSTSTTPNNTIYALLEEDTSYDFSSTFGDLLSSLPKSSIIDNLGQFARTVTGGKISFSSQFKQMGFQVWKSTAPITFSLNLAFYAYTNAKTEVYDPIVALCKLPLPKSSGLGNFKPPGPSFSLTERKNTGDENPKKKAFSSKRSKGRHYAITVGTITFPDVIITKANPTFSSEVSKISGKHYPISGRCTIDVSTTMSAYQGMVDNIFNSIT